MSLTSSFLTLHESLATDLKTKYPSYNIVKSESELSMGEFPAIGIFLGASEHSTESRTYAPIRYSYILAVFDVYDFDSPTDLLAKQQSMFELMEDIISKTGYKVLTYIEPTVSIGIDVGSFITGWTTAIEFNA